MSDGNTKVRKQCRLHQSVAPTSISIWPDTPVCSSVATETFRRAESLDTMFSLTLDEYSLLSSHRQRYSLHSPSVTVYEAVVYMTRAGTHVVGCGTGSAVGAGIGSAVGAGIGSAVGAGIGRDVGAGIGRDVGAGFGSDVGAALGGVVGSAVGAGVGGVVGAGVGAAVGGSHRPHILLHMYARSPHDGQNSVLQ